MGTPWVLRNPRPIAGPAQVLEILDLAAEAAPGAAHRSHEIGAAGTLLIFS
jgi:hypothetical protein